MEPTLICHNCQTLYLPEAYFCPNCGKKLRDKPLSTSVAKQIAVYLTSLFLPPFGLIPGIKYLKQEDSKSKMIGVLAISITLISLIVSIMIAVNVASSLNKVVGGQLNPYGGFGLQ